MTRIQKIWKHRLFLQILLVVLFSGSFPISVTAYDVGSRIRATGGATQVEGSAGGGLVPWAVMSGYGQEGEWGGNVYATYAKTGDYDLAVAGANISFNNRVEISISSQMLGIDALADDLSLPDNRLKMITAGIKVRLAGDLIYGDIPQVSIGLQYKKNIDFDVPELTGAKDNDDVDVYLAATRLWLHGIAGYPLLTNITIRSTRANQIGFLGFGGDKDNGRDFVFEGSAGLLLRRDLVLGYEFRQKPDNLNFAEEEDWHDVFISWFPNKHFNLTGAWVNMGTVAGKPGQDGFYLSVQGTY